MAIIARRIVDPARIQQWHCAELDIAQIGYDAVDTRLLRRDEPLERSASEIDEADPHALVRQMLHDAGTDTGRPARYQSDAGRLAFLPASVSTKA